MSSVGRRRYDSPVRRQRAMESRGRVIEAAADVFVTDGWTHGTMNAIARRAGLSIDTVRAAGSKANLLLEAFRTRYAGAGEWRSILDAPAVQQILDIHDAESGLEATVDFVARGVSRSARLWLEIRIAAMGDLVVAEELAELNHLRVQSFLRTAEWMVRIGLVAEPDDDAALADLAMNLGLLMSHENYLLLVDDHGFDDEAYRRWLRGRLASLRPIGADEGAS